MKKKFKIVIIIIIIFIGISKVIFKKSEFNYNIKYQNINFKVTERHYSSDIYIEISKEKSIYPFRINMLKKSKIITKVYYYKDKEYECLLPLVNDSIVVDLMCYKDNIMYNYSMIYGEDLSLDEYVDAIKEYNIKNFQDDTSKNIQNGDSFFYPNNDIKKNIYISSYRGVTSSKKNFNIFDNDVYDNKLSVFINNYYIVADYSKSFEFNKFYVLNLKTNKITTINTKSPISFDSYIQGIVGDNIYLYDKDNEAQFEINIETNSIKEVSTNKKIKYYKNGAFEYVNKPKNELFFDYSSLNNYFTKYDNVVETDNYYYLFKEKNEGYSLYRVDINNTKYIKYLFDVPTLDIKYKGKYLYFYNDGKIYYYDDYCGLRTIIYNNELKFNKTIKCYVF